MQRGTPGEKAGNGSLGCAASPGTTRYSNSSSKESVRSLVYAEKTEKGGGKKQPKAAGYAGGKALRPLQEKAAQFCLHAIAAPCGGWHRSQTSFRMDFCLLQANPSAPKRD